MMLGKSGKMMEKSTWLAGATMSISSGAIGPEGDEDLKVNSSVFFLSVFCLIFCLFWLKFWSRLALPGLFPQAVLFTK